MNNRRRRDRTAEHSHDRRPNHQAGEPPTDGGAGGRAAAHSRNPNAIGGAVTGAVL
jgi:hypothetical protein